MSSLKLQLFGSPHLVKDGALVKLGRSKAMALFVYLAVTEQVHSRDTLAALFWPDSDQNSARADLSRILSVLKKALGERWLMTDHQTVGLVRSSDLWLDVAEFRRHMAAYRSHAHPPDIVCPDCFTLLREAVTLCQGDFLAGFSLSDCPEFEIWQLFQAEDLHLALSEALQKLTHWYSDKDEPGRAIGHARHWLALDPLHEPAHRALIELYSRAGQQTAALRQYEECKRLLAKELGVEPTAETTALVQHIRLGRAQPAPHDTANPSQDAEQIPPASPLAAIEPTVQKTGSVLAGPSPAFLREGTEAAQVFSTPFVARERELAQLHIFLQAALLSQGRVVFVTGEAGSGKTALVREFSARAQEHQHDLIVAVGSCNVYTGVGDPYLPFRDIIGMLTADVEALWEAGKMSRNHALRLWQLLPHTAHVLLDHGPDLIDTFVPGKALVDRLAAYGSGEFGHLVRLQAQQMRSGVLRPDQNRLFEEFSAVLAAVATRQPLCLILDDLQWADTSSIGLLFHLGRRLADSRILIVGTYRPEDVALGWQGRAHPLEEVVSEFKRDFGAITIDLDQIERAGGRQFVDALLDTEPNLLDEDFRQALFRHSRGNPLFASELLRDMQDRNDLIRNAKGRWVESPNLSWERMPAKVEGVIERRIGRLAPELREALTIASVEGETFTAEMVASVQAVDERAFIRRLSSELERQHRLVHAQEIRHLGSKRISVYRFRHNLFQRYLYNALDQVTGAYLHEDVGRALEQLYHGHSDELTALAGQLAWHFEEAGVTEKALDYRFLAGQQAVRIFANAEAAAHFSEALALLRTLPDTPERAQQELALQIALGVPVTAVKGYAHPDVKAVYARACELCRQVGDTTHLFPALYGLWRFYLIRSELQAARELGGQLMQLAQNAQGQELMVEAYRAVGCNSFHLGEFPAARAAFEHGLALYDAQGHRPHAFVYGHDPAVSCLGYLASTLWLLGFIDQALERTNEVLALARNLAHPFSLGHALVWGAAKLHQFCGNAQHVQALAEEGMALAAKHAFPFWETQGRIMLGWALAQQGRLEEGLAQMHQGMAAWQATGARSVGPYFLALLAEAYGRAGEAERGLAILADAVAAVDSTKERWWEAELYRLEGELLLMQHADPLDPLEIEACFRQALTVARQQQARTLELRATMSLCRLWQRQGKLVEAQQVLTKIYDWFTEGWDTRDLQEAEILLSELNTLLPIQRLTNAPE